MPFEGFGISRPRWPTSSTMSCSATCGSGRASARATAAANYRTNEMPFHFKRALENGVTREEIGEIITHLAFYSGWPTAATATAIARKVFEEAK